MALPLRSTRGEVSRSLEVFHLLDRKRYAQEQAFAEGDVVRASPFDAIDLDLTAIRESIAPEDG